MSEQPQTRTVATQKLLFANLSWTENWHRPITEAIAELEREANVRLKCYDRWITEARMSYVEAKDRMQRHLTAIRLLRKLEIDLEDRAAKEELEQATGPGN